MSSMSLGYSFDFHHGVVFFSLISVSIWILIEDRWKDVVKIWNIPLLLSKAYTF